MTAWGWIDELDADAATDELARCYQLLVTAEVTQLMLAAHWADLHDPEYVAECVAVLPGMPAASAVRTSNDGAPAIAWHAGAELAALLRCSTRTGEAIIDDAVALRHRHPLLWQALQRGEARVWLARKVAQRCRAVGLDAALTQQVDAATTPSISTLTPAQFLKLAEATIVAVDPAAAEERARVKRLTRDVTVGPSDEDGMRTLVARAAAGDLVHVSAVLDRIAHILAEQGDPEPVGARRATALRILANPARALALLLGRTADGQDPALETFEEPEGEARDEVLPWGDAAWMLDASGRPLIGMDDVDLTDEPLPAPDARTECDEPVAALFASGGPVLGAAPAERADVGEHLDPTLLRSLLDALTAFDAGRLDPACVLHVHVTDTTLATRSGVVRVEELGPLVLGELRDWLADPYASDHLGCPMTVRPVLDAGAVRPVDGYEWTGRMRELGVVRRPVEAFPWGTLRSRRCDDDHVEPYRRTRDGRPARAGQTRVGNNAKLSRFHHNLKTHAGWRLVHPEPGVYWWRTRHGHWLRVDRTGTTYHGRDPDLDARWPEHAAHGHPVEPAATPAA